MDDLGLEQAYHCFGERVVVRIPTLPTEGSMPASASRSLYLIETYWARVVLNKNSLRKTRSSSITLNGAGLGAGCTRSGPAIDSSACLFRQTSIVIAGNNARSLKTRT